MYNFGRSRYISFKEYNQDELFLVHPSLHDFLPEGPLARVIHELVIQGLDLRTKFSSNWASVND
jgi:hypothetical protein